MSIPQCLYCLCIKLLGPSWPGCLYCQGQWMEHRGWPSWLEQRSLGTRTNTRDITLPQPPKCPKASGAIKQDQKRNKPAGRKNNGKIIDTQHSQDECWNLLESYSTLNLYRVKTIKTYKKISHLSFILITIPSCSLERCLIFWTQDKASKTGNICKSLSTQTRNSNHFIQPEPEGQDSKKIKNSRRWQFSPSPELSLVFSEPIPGS